MMARKILNTFLIFGLSMSFDSLCLLKADPSQDLAAQEEEFGAVDQAKLIGLMIAPPLLTRLAILAACKAIFRGKDLRTQENAAQYAGRAVSPFVSSFLVSDLMYKINPAFKKLSSGNSIFDMVQSISKKFGMKCPNVYFMNCAEPNAWVAGRNSLVVTSGLVKRVTTDELEAILGHEIGHRSERDILTTTVMAGVTGCASRFVAQKIVGSKFMQDKIKERGPDGEICGIKIKGLTTSLIPAAASVALNVLSFLPISRYQEYRADRRSAQVVKKPKALASALQKITMIEGGPVDIEHMLFKLQIKLFGDLLMTHPLTEKRVRALERFKPKQCSEPAP